VGPALWQRRDTRTCDGVPRSPRRAPPRDPACLRTPAPYAGCSKLASVAEAWPPQPRPVLCGRRPPPAATAARTGCGRGASVRASSGRLHSRCGGARLAGALLSARRRPPPVAFLQERARAADDYAIRQVGGKICLRWVGKVMVVCLHARPPACCARKLGVPFRLCDCTASIPLQLTSAQLDFSRHTCAVLCAYRRWILVPRVLGGRLLLTIDRIQPRLQIQEPHSVCLRRDFVALYAAGATICVRMRWQRSCRE